MKIFIFFLVIISLPILGKKTVPIMLPRVKFEVKKDKDSKKIETLKELLTISSQSGIFKAQKQIRGITFSLIDEDAQKQALKEQGDQNVKGCYNNECLVSTGKMLAAKKIAKITVKQLSTKNWRISGKIIDVESGAIENVEISYCKNCSLDTIEKFEGKVIDLSEKLLVTLFQDQYESASNSDSRFSDSRELDVKSISFKEVDKNEMRRLEKNKKEAFDRLDRLTSDKKIKTVKSDDKFIEALDLYLGHNKKTIDYKQSFNSFNTLARKGDSRAIAWVGIMYHKGFGVTKNSYEGRKWIKKALNNGLESKANMDGDKEAKVLMGIIYDNGYGGYKVDYKRAKSFYESSLPHSIGYSNLGDMYYYGHFVKSDISKSIEYFKKSAEMGNASAQSWLGYIYKNEKGFLNYKVAFNWFLKAASQGDVYSIRNLAEIYYDGLAGNKDRKAAFKWFKYAAEKGDVKSQSWVGYCYREGQGVEKNEYNAKSWYTMAAKKGDSYSMHQLGDIFYDKKDYSNAFQWFKKGADKNYRDSSTMLGKLYHNGWGVSKNYSLAFKYFSKAANRGERVAQSWMGYCYEFGTGVTKNIEKARDWYKKAIKQNDNYSMFRLGMTYYNKKDYNSAFKWLKMGADYNHFDAMVKIGECYANGWGTSKNFNQAFKYFSKTAPKGDMKSMEWMGYCYEFGKGTYKSVPDAMKWYRKAKEKGSEYGKNRYNILKSKGYFEK